MTDQCMRRECAAAREIVAAVVAEQVHARETYEAAGRGVGEAHDRWMRAWRRRVVLVNAWMRKAGGR